MNFLAGIPLFYAKILTGFFYLLLVFWVWRRPKNFVMRQAPTPKKWRDLRLWAVLLIGFQIFLYIIF